ncbi:VOC family protein [Microtetraspora malaysiensis]|uniref:VOC family protein n=1 Tax=Microtetraspora malaysiensis TaxID=161358 RepID=UPI003D900CB6
MSMELDVVIIPVADVDTAKHCYEGLGWRLDADFVGDDGFRVVEVTPPRSSCSIISGTGISSAAPGSAQSLHRVVSDIEATKDELLRGGAKVSEVFHDAAGVSHRAGTTNRVQRLAAPRRSRRGCRGVSGDGR